MTALAQGSVTPGWKSPFVMSFLLNLVWINASEVFRYFAFVMPMMREAFAAIPEVAPMNLQVFMVWGVWDTILVAAATLIPWMALRTFGGSLRNAVLSGTGVWLAVFGILWLGLYNMNLATPEILGIALPLAWLEMVVASMIVWWLCFRNDAAAQ